MDTSVSVRTLRRATELLEILYRHLSNRTRAWGKRLEPISQPGLIKMTTDSQLLRLYQIQMARIIKEPPMRSRPLLILLSGLAIPLR